MKDHLLCHLLITSQLLILVVVQVQAGNGLLDFMNMNKNKKFDPVGGLSGDLDGTGGDPKQRQKGYQQAADLAADLTAMNGDHDDSGRLGRRQRRPKLDLDALFQMAEVNENRLGTRRHRGPVRYEQPPSEDEVLNEGTPREWDNDGEGGQSNVESKSIKDRLKPDLSNIKNAATSTNTASTTSHAGKSLAKICRPEFLKKKLKSAYKVSRNSVREALMKDLPNFVGHATDSMSALLNLNNRNALLRMFGPLENSITFLREEFSKFTINWSPMMEAATNYIGLHSLYKLKWNENDELDFRHDALTALAMGYEFMRIMTVWRENLLVAHSAFKVYLESVKNEILDSREPECKPVIDDAFVYHMEAIHNYILFNSWLEIDAEILESRMKLTFLSSVYDDRTKNYESDYFRHIVYYQELYDPTLDEFKRERRQVIDAVKLAVSSFANEFPEIDEFLVKFENLFPEDAELRSLIEVPETLSKFMEEVRPQVEYNPRIYTREFLKDLKEAKRKLISTG